MGRAANKAATKANFHIDALFAHRTANSFGSERGPEANDVTGYYCGGNNRQYTMKLLAILPWNQLGIESRKPLT
jgi:hypothetical protein